MAHPLRTLAIGVCFIVVAALVLIPLPYYSIGPGPARDVTPLIRFEDRQRFEPSGHLTMTTVRYNQLTALGLALSWLDPERDVVHRSLLYPDDVGQEALEERAISEMDQSKIAATAVVLRKLEDYPRSRGTGSLVESTVPTCPADGQLFPGDVITAIDGEPIESRRAASRAIDAVPPGDEMTFDLQVDGRAETAAFTRAPCGLDGEALVGVRLIDTFPVDVSISSGDVGGPSAGLMWALGLYELMTPGDMTAGRLIAGTGQLGLDGRVYKIGGVRDKALAATNAGADVFLVPARNLDELDGMDTGDMELIGVRTFEQARRALEQAEQRA